LVAAHNADVLDLNLSYCEAVISSHGHTDHAGGLLNIRKKMNAKQNIPLQLKGIRYISNITQDNAKLAKASSGRRYPDKRCQKSTTNELWSFR
jgi:metal-dependent hydrolase (beta-lactamase superfamily II)